MIPTILPLCSQHREMHLAPRDRTASFAPVIQMGTNSGDVVVEVILQNPVYIIML